MIEKFQQLQDAKKAVIACLEKDGTLINMNGLVYWAKEVERLRQEIREKL